MIYLVYQMRLTSKARQDMQAFWSWMRQRETWFYEHLPMVEEVRWYYSLVGDVYTVESWSAFADEAAWGRYRAALSNLKADRDWESQRTSQDEWWDFLGTRMVTDPPVDVGFRRT